MPILIFVSCDEPECIPEYEFDLIGEHYNLTNKDTETGVVVTYNLDSTLDARDGIEYYIKSYNQELDPHSVNVVLSLEENSVFTVEYENGTSEWGYNSGLLSGTWNLLTDERYYSVFNMAIQWWEYPFFRPDARYELTFSNGKTGYIDVYEKYNATACQRVLHLLAHNYS